MLATMDKYNLIFPSLQTKVKVVANKNFR